MSNHTGLAGDWSKPWIEQLNDSKAGKRDEALRESAKLKDPKAIPAIVEVLKGDKNDSIRKFAASALKEISHADALESLMQALGQEEKASARKEIIAAVNLSPEAASANPHVLADS